MRRVWAGLAVALITCTAITGCSTAASTTCKDFGSRKATDQSSLVNEMIRAHGLNPLSNIYGSTAMLSEIRTFCGISEIRVLTGQQVAATQNLDSAIERAINWKVYGG